ncbi:MAG: VPA1262 family N-terminal domain-containing protein [Candidatus Binataceae bacterium]
MDRDSGQKSSERALVHLAWRRYKEERRLIFGWVELLPAAMPYLRGHPFVAHRVKGTEQTYVYVARFPMTADAAEHWYEVAKAGALKLPVHPDKTTAGDNSLLLAPPKILEPEGGGESMAMELPFLPASHGAVYVRGLFPDAPEDSHSELEDAETAEWLADQLFFDLRDHRLYLGSLLHTRYSSRLRAVERHLEPRTDGDDEVIRLTTWPGADMKGAEIFAIERRPLGFSELVRLTITESVLRLPWSRRVVHTGLAIIHPEDGLCWWSDIGSFVRTIFFGGEIGESRLQVVIEGKTRERFDVTRRIPLHSGGSMVIGETPRPFSVPALHVRDQSAQERRRISDRLGVRWFDDPLTAANHIRALLQQASQYARIIDPYFSAVEIVRFALAVSSKTVPVEIVTSAEHLRKEVDGVELGETLEKVLHDVQNHVTVSAKVLAGESAPLHDRFLVIDRRIWLSGNSLNAIGERASVLIEIPDPSRVRKNG